MTNLSQKGFYRIIKQSILESLKCKECCDIIQGSDIYICDPEEIT